MKDESTRLMAELNRRRDRIEQRMDGVRHVSNTIIHKLNISRVRIRSHLDTDLNSIGEVMVFTYTPVSAIEDIEDLAVVPRKL